MKILSIMWGENSTAALVVDGEVIACVSEERFSRLKNDERYPRQAIEAVLGIGRVQPAELDAVAFAGEMFNVLPILVHRYSGFSVGDRLREQREYWYPRMYEGRDVSYLDVFHDRIDTEQYGGGWEDVLALIRSGRREDETAFYQQFRRRAVFDHLGIAPEKVQFVNHHRAHAFYAYFGSPVTRGRVLVLTADAWGDNTNASVSVAEGGRITLLSASGDFQLARLYRYITLLLGLKPDEHEYKVMGLAAYARPEFYQEPLRVFRETQYVEGLGFAYRIRPPDLYVYFRDRLEGYRFDAIAGALQHYTDEIVTEWSRNAVSRAATGRVVFAGGIAMNVKAMMQVAGLSEVQELHVLPAPGDESLTIGAAYVLEHEALRAAGKDPALHLHPLPHAYLGPEPSPGEVASVVRELASDPSYRVHRNSPGGGRPAAARVAALLADGKIGGRCTGRSEFGARALGNRSILADPRRPGVVRTINERIKSRDFWMPLAPAILDRRADEYLAGRKGMAAPFMTLAFRTTPRAHDDLVAALHPADLTCRPQVLERAHNPAFYDLLVEFERLTGVGGVLNTSFNLHGEPIVQAPGDAARVFTLSGLDFLWLDSCLIEKSG